MSSQATNMCQTHKSEELRFICEETACNYELLCPLCIGDHKGHSIEILQKFMQNRVLKSTKIVNEIKGEIKGSRRESELKHKKEVLVKAKEEIESIYWKKLVDFIKILMEQKNQKLRGIEEVIVEINNILHERGILNVIGQLFEKERNLLISHKEQKYSELRQLLTSSNKILDEVELQRIQYNANIKYIKEFNIEGLIKNYKLPDMEAIVMQFKKDGENYLLFDIQIGPDPPMSETKMAMLEDEYKSCEHPKSITYYCELCNLFICKECTKDHKAHIAKIYSWDLQIKKYQDQVHNLKLRVMDLTTTKVDPTKLKSDLFKKCESSFQHIKTQIEQSREKLKKEIWNRRDKAKLINSIESDLILEKEINEHTRVIEKFLDVEDKEGLMKLLCCSESKSELSDIEKRLDAFRPIITAHAKEIKDFIINETLDEQKVESMLTYIAPFIKGEVSVTESHYFPTKTWIRLPGHPQTISCPSPLPAFFAITLRKSKGVDMICGVCKQDIGQREEVLGGSKEGEYAIRADGALMGSGKVTHGNPSTLLVDTIVIRYEKTQKLTFEYGGKRQVKGFKNVEGPFYLAITLPLEGTQVQIQSVEMI